jgi:hypothetical protein
MTKYSAIALACFGLVAAIVAASYWWRASRVEIPQSSASITDVPALYIMSTQVAFNESSRLNSIASVWTGAAAILSAAASVVGLF